MTTDKVKILGTEEAWESGELGENLDSAKKYVIEEDLINESLGLKQISIRLQHSLINDFKFIAEAHGIGYQTLIRQMLTRFAANEKNKIMGAVHSKAVREQREVAEALETEAAMQKMVEEDCDQLKTA